MLKVLQARLQQYMNRELPDVQASLEKAEEPEIKLQTYFGSSKKQEFQNNSALLSTPTPLTLWITTNWKILQEMGVPDHLTCLLRNLYAGQEATELDMEQQTGSKSGKDYVKAICCHPVSLTLVGWMKHKLESRLLGEISITSNVQMTPALWQKVKKN